MNRGVFIAFEGIDGAGTTTQAARLHRRLPAAHLTHEPSPRPLGVVLRRALGHEIDMAPEAMALAFAGDRLDHWTGEIRPALHRGDCVICDRYLLSSLAYQSLSAPLDWVATLNGFAGRPDLTLFLRVSPEVAAERRSARRGSPERFEKDSFQRRVADRYEELLSRDDIGPVTVIDSHLNPDEVESSIWAVVEPVLNAWEVPR